MLAEGKFLVAVFLARAEDLCLHLHCIVCSLGFLPVMCPRVFHLSLSFSYFYEMVPNHLCVGLSFVKRIHLRNLVECLILFYFWCGLKRRCQMKSIILVDVH